MDSTMQLGRLRGRKAVDRVRRKGRQWRGKHFSITVLRSIEGHVVLGTSASLKLHPSAVKRNRMRRRCREALRISVCDSTILPHCQLLLIPRSSSLSCDFSEILRDAREFLTTLAQHARS